MTGVQTCALPIYRETIDKMVERLEEFDDVQTVYTNMKPEESEE